MTFPQAVIFDLGGTLLDVPEGEGEMKRRWMFSYQILTGLHPDAGWPDSETYVRAMREAEAAHWQRVERELWSGPPSGVLSEGFRRLGCQVTEQELLSALDGYAQAVAGWALPFPDARETLRVLRQSSYRLGLLSNTWWAAEWHDADLATHGLNELFDVVVYTSDLPHSKPHPSVFLNITARLGVEPQACVMVGDRMIDDITGALGVGMRAIWRRNDRSPRPAHIVPTATITHLAELPPLLQKWREGK